VEGLVTITGVVVGRFLRLVKEGEGESGLMHLELHEGQFLLDLSQSAR